MVKAPLSYQNGPRPSRWCKGFLLPPPSSLERKYAAPLAQEDYVRRLVNANQKLLADAARARDLAGEVNDPESQDLMIGRITLHQKTLWMLKSFLKG